MALPPHTPVPLPSLPGLGPEAARPVVMGIVNVSDDSFSGDSLKGDAARAIQQARAQVAAGAGIIDLGAESTRPGAAPVSAKQEIDRLLPVLEGLRDLGRPISVDTRNAATMRAAAAAGVAIINDIAALEGEGSLAAAAESRLPVILMHMQGEPGSMQQAPQYQDVVAEVLAYLAARIAACAAAGIAREKLIVDPGIGFGKTMEHNLALLRALPRFHALGCPVLLGVSRKSFIGKLASEPDPARRLPGSLAAGLWGAAQGVAILRVHDVAETVQALTLWRAAAGQA